MQLSDAEPPQAARWVILVSREHAELCDHLCQAFFRDGRVQVVLDRRGDEARNPRWVIDQLCRDGVVLIRVPPSPAHSTERRPEDG